MSEGQQVKQWMKAQGLTAKELGARLGMGTTAIYAIFNSAELKLRTRLALAHIGYSPPKEKK